MMKMMMMRQEEERRRTSAMMMMMLIRMSSKFLVMEDVVDTQSQSSPYVEHLWSKMMMPIEMGDDGAAWRKDYLALELLLLLPPWWYSCRWWRRCMHQCHVRYCRCRRRG
jgi:hypothetical protein